MILDSLENRARYYALNPRLEKAFDYLLSTDLGALPAGRHAIDGDDRPEALGQSLDADDRAILRGNAQFNGPS